MSYPFHSFLEIEASVNSAELKISYSYNRITFLKNALNSI